MPNINSYTKGGTVAENHERDSLPLGVPLEHFRAAVEVLAQLRDSGRLIVFLSPRGTVKFIGDDEIFDRTFSQKFGDAAVSPDERAKAKNEVRSVLLGLLVFGSSSNDFLERSVYEGKLERAEGEMKSRLKEELDIRKNLVTERLVTRALKERNDRLSTSRGDCLDDLEVEVITERYLKASDTRLRGPFLKLQFRVFTGISPAPLLVHTFREILGGSGKTIELECDETDLALMEDRIRSFREMLLKATEPAEGEKGNK
jgi:hypothetical protein